jgi:hypothetical protein
MSIKPLLDAGPGDRESREYIADIVQIAVEASPPVAWADARSAAGRANARSAAVAATCPPGVPP